MKWPKSQDDLTKSIWDALSPSEQFDAFGFWVRQNRLKGRMSRRAARNRVRQILWRKNILPRPLTTLGRDKLLNFTYKAQPLLDIFNSDRKRMWRPGPKRLVAPGDGKTHFIPVSKFSLFEDPKAVFDQLRLLSEYEATVLELELDFKDQRITDIGPYLVLAILYRRMCRFINGGRISGPVRRVMRATELDKYIGMQPLLDDAAEVADVFPIPLAEWSPLDQTTQTRSDDSSRTEKTASRAARKIEYWFRELGVSLPNGTFGPLQKALTEVLNNAEQHAQKTSGPHCDKTGGWCVAGFMARREASDGSVSHVCHLSVVGLGLTIPETLMETDPSSDRFWPQLGKYSQSGGVGLNSSVRALILSLQDGVTSKSDPSGGKGMQELLTLVARMGRTEVGQTGQVAIVSGRTCVHVNNLYIDRATEIGQHRQQWLNDRNLETCPPDRGLITDIGVEFPGTIVSIRFVIDPKHHQQHGSGSGIVKSQNEWIYRVKYDPNEFGGPA